MQVHRAAAYVPTVVSNASQATLSSGMTTTSTGATAASNTSVSSDAGIQQADFTHMTRKGLADWMNAQIKSGRMSLDDSSGLLGMTMAVPVNAPSGRLTLDDRAQIDFFALAQDGMAWARQHGDSAQLQTLQKAMDIMTQHQGESISVDVRV